ncbi:p24 complex component [Dimargaris verticillata]|uniref:P24 complex component n=1 Tax=Dimargaris verticillata TaxID=2761393 RepID=A0A9W8EAW6_9FUNG|nr:p24 complex component [Dimargaris verticillata]
MRGTFLLLVLASLVGCALGYRIDLKPYKQQCFYDEVGNDGYYTISYEVLDNQIIDFTLTGPNGQTVTNILQKSNGYYDISQPKDAGRYKFCFNNPNNSPSPKSVAFHAHGLDPDHLLPIEEKASPMEKEVIHLAQTIESTLDHFDYMINREELHRNTAESTNARVKWWSAIQILVVIAACGWQIWYLKSFFEVKRVV